MYCFSLGVNDFLNVGKYREFCFGFWSFGDDDDDDDDDDGISGSSIAISNLVSLFSIFCIH